MVENVGYRQLVAVWRTLAFLDLARGGTSWGGQERRGIGDSGDTQQAARSQLPAPVTRKEERIA
ncbi:MAG: hypothetical protein HYX52_04885 [Chloroflexi bacterium]|nr:hypothetical protein [Chloroflexota bacterium]